MSDPTAYLLDELAALQAENKELRRKVLALSRSRAHWREESRAWQWGAMARALPFSTPSPDLSPPERAAAS